MSKLEQNELPPIFIYSGFRACSTWLWSKFRECDQFRCYYEVFNEELATIDFRAVMDRRPSGWRSRHPEGKPYYLEFAPLLSEGGGIPEFPAEPASGCRWIGPGGIDGSLTEDVDSYISTLISAAQREGKGPVITCTRMLGLIGAMRSRFAGLHILLVRNLFRQWNSFSGQCRSGNESFLYNLYLSMALREVDPFVRKASSIFAQEAVKSFQAWNARENSDKVFCYFVALHVYLLAKATPHADVIIDVNELSKTSGHYRHNIERRIFEHSKVKVDLSGANDQIDYPQYPIESESFCRDLINVLYDAMVESLGGDERHFARRLIEECWAEYEKFSLYTRASDELLEQLTASLTQSHNEARLLQQTLLDSEHVIAQSEQRLVAEREEFEEKQRDLQNKINIAQQKLVGSENAQTVLTKRLSEHEAMLEREQREIRIREMERRRLFEDLKLEGGPAALRAVLPIARIVRRIIRWHGSIKRHLFRIIRLH